MEKFKCTWCFLFIEGFRLTPRYEYIAFRILKNNFLPHADYLSPFGVSGGPYQIWKNLPRTLLGAHTQSPHSPPWLLSWSLEMWRPPRPAPVGDPQNSAPFFWAKKWQACRITKRGKTARHFDKYYRKWMESLCKQLSNALEVKVSTSPNFIQLMLQIDTKPRFHESEASNLHPTIRKAEGPPATRSALYPKTSSRKGRLPRKPFEKSESQIWIHHRSVSLRQQVVIVERNCPRLISKVDAYCYVQISIDGQELKKIETPKKSSLTVLLRNFSMDFPQVQLLKSFNLDHWTHSSGSPLRPATPGCHLAPHQCRWCWWCTWSTGTWAGGLPILGILG